MGNTRYFCIGIAVVAAVANLIPDSATGDEAKRPNILWLSAEDISPHFGCYGDPHSITPAIDLLAEEGVRYTNAFTTAGVCAPCRSGIITGMYQTTIGTHHMRCVAKLPDFIQPFPLYLRQAGYYCTNNSKTDYQFPHDKQTWDESGGKAHWRKRQDVSQPFFAVFNFTGCHESGIANKSKYLTVTKQLNAEERQEPAKLTTLPPYYPDTQITREDWKRNYELITAMDHWVDDLIKQLKADGLYEETIIFFWSDHGVGLPCAKRWLYDSGTHIPLVVRIPKQFQVNGQGEPVSVSDQLVSSIDFGPTVLNLAGVNKPAHMQGQAFLGSDLAAPREYVFAARDRMDERYDIIRMVRDKRFRYIRNYEPWKTYYQFMNTPEQGATMKEIRRQADAGTLPEPARQFMMRVKPTEELYDLTKDPHELHNLADQPNYRDTLQRLRKAHLKWMRDTKDLGLVPEPLLSQREADLGSRFEVLRQEDGEQLLDRLISIAALASADSEALPKLFDALRDPDASIRYWAATGIGNMRGAMSTEETAAARKRIVKALQDESSVVRVAAAGALSRLGQAQFALPVLTDSLASDQQWVRLQAAIVLDEMGEDARPAIAALREALVGQPNKYIVRVSNHALNQLEGTNRATK